VLDHWAISPVQVISFSFFAVLGLELWAYTFCWPFFCDGFFQDKSLSNYLPRLALNCDPSDLCLLSS
jgi:hypothetical protein